MRSRKGLLITGIKKKKFQYNLYISSKEKLSMGFCIITQHKMKIYFQSKYKMKVGSQLTYHIII